MGFDKKERKKVIYVYLGIPLMIIVFTYIILQITEYYEISWNLYDQFGKLDWVGPVDNRP